MRYLLIIILALQFSLIQAQTSAISLTPGKADSFYFSGKWDQAITLFEKAIENGQKNGLIYYRLGSSYSQSGNKEKALSTFYNCIAQNPNPNLLRVVIVSICKIYSENNQLDSAMTTFTRAVNMGYNNLFEIENDKAFAGIRILPEFKKLHEQIMNAAYPCMSQKEARWFDFWIGEWDVYVTGSKNQAGISKIEKIAGECAILENWTSASSAFNGKSINFYNTHSQKWEQHWVGSAGGYQKFENGEYIDEAMRFTFIRINNDTTKSTGKFIFFNQGPNQVRQFSESSNDQGKTWNVDYDFTYIRKNTNQR